MRKEVKEIEELKKHEKDYKKDSWQEYSEVELQWWVTLLRKRASHRNNYIKMTKDLYDANNYQKMLDETRRYKKENY